MKGQSELKVCSLWPSNTQEGLPVQQQKRERLQRQGPALPSLERPWAQRAPMFTEAAQPCLSPDGTGREPVQRIIHPALGGALA